MEAEKQLSVIVEEVKGNRPLSKRSKRLNKATPMQAVIMSTLSAQTLNAVKNVLPKKSVTPKSTTTLRGSVQKRQVKSPKLDEEIPFSQLSQDSSPEFRSKVDSKEKTVVEVAKPPRKPVMIPLSKDTSSVISGQTMDLLKRIRTQGK